MRVRYYLSDGHSEREVTRADYVEAERAAGLYNTHGREDDPATAAFSAGHLSGRIEYVTSSELSPRPSGQREAG